MDQRLGPDAINGPEMTGCDGASGQEDATADRHHRLKALRLLMRVNADRHFVTRTLKTHPLRPHIRFGIVFCFSTSIGFYHGC